MLANSARMHTKACPNSNGASPCSCCLVSSLLVLFLFFFASPSLLSVMVLFFFRTASLFTRCLFLTLQLFVSDSPVFLSSSLSTQTPGNQESVSEEIRKKKKILIHSLSSHSCFTCLNGSVRKHQRTHCDIHVRHVNWNVIFDPPPPGVGPGKLCEGMEGSRLYEGVSCVI